MPKTQEKKATPNPLRLEPRAQILRGATRHLDILVSAVSHHHNMAYLGEIQKRIQELMRNSLSSYCRKRALQKGKRTRKKKEPLMTPPLPRTCFQVRGTQRPLEGANIMLQTVAAITETCPVPHQRAIWECLPFDHMAHQVFGTG